MAPSRAGHAERVSRAVAVAVVLLLPDAAQATFHFARISELMTSLGGNAGVQFVEITMESAGQHLVSGSKLNVFDADGDFVMTAVTPDGNVSSGSGRAWIMGTPAFETASGIQADFEFPNGTLPMGGGMVCWGKPGATASPVNCPTDGTPYVDCVAYGSYNGPTNSCIGTPTSLTPDGHSLARGADTRNNANDFECADPATPENNDGETGSLAATTPCTDVTTTITVTTTTIEATTTTTSPISTTTLPTTTTTTLPPFGCGDANGDEAITASDALTALRTAVGTSTCAPTACDVDSNGSITAADALRILRRAVGGDVTLTCPPE